MSNPIGNYMSLYDYLGKAAGLQLGSEVMQTALAGKVKWLERYISNKAYKGKVNLYPLDFLEDYFSVNPKP